MSFMLLNQVIATHILRIRAGVSGEMILNNHFDNKEQFAYAINKIEEKFEKHFKKTTKISMYVSELWPLDISPEIERFIHNYSGNQLIRKPEARRDDYYELSLLKNSEDVITRGNFEEGLVLSIHRASGESFTLNLMHPDEVVIWDWFHGPEIHLPIRVAEFFADRAQLDGLEYVDWIDSRTKEQIHRIDTFNSLSLATFNQLLERLEHVRLSSVIGPLHTIRPDTPCVKVALEHIRMDYTYHQYRPVKYFATDVVWPLFESPDGTLDPDQSKQFIKTIGLSWAVESVEIRKSGTRFDVYPAEETAESTFRVSEMYVKPSQNEKEYHMFYMKLYDPAYGYLTLDATAPRLDIRTEEYRTTDFFGFDYAGIEAIEYFIVSLQKFICEQQINCYPAVDHWDTCFGCKLIETNYNLTDHFTKYFGILRNKLSNGKRTGRGPLMTISPATE